MQTLSLEKIEHNFIYKDEWKSPGDVQRANE